MDYTIGAKPTMYTGHRFRSRLEARWAAFFDLCGWRWEYEPRDLPGWSPDFVLIGASRVWVEVKPITELAEFADTGRLERALLAAKAREDILLVGLGPFEVEGSTAIGWLAQAFAGSGDDTVWDWGEGIVGVASLEDNELAPLDVCHSCGSYQGRLTGFYNGSLMWQTPRVQELWARACSMVQWLKDG